MFSQATTVAAYRSARKFASMLPVADQFHVIDAIILTKVRLGLPCGRYEIRRAAALVEMKPAPLAHTGL